MRQTISGLLTAFAVLFAGAAPAMACGYSTCCGYTSPCAQSYAPVYAPTYAPTFGTGCGACGGGWGYEHLAAPETQYYYVNQGPTFTGPGQFAPNPVYRAEPGWAAYEQAPGYYHGGYEAPAYYGYRWHHWHHYRHYAYHAYHYGYSPYHYRHYPILRRYY
jgi:hypothetical protein